MPDEKLYIHDVPIANVLSLTDKVPLSQGTTDPVTASIGQITTIAHLIELNAGEEISGSRVVRTDSALAMVADSTNATHAASVIGVAINAVRIGEVVHVRTYGEFTDPALSLTPGKPVYFDTLGRLTNAVPVTGFIQCIGTAITATKVQINICSPITL